MKKRFFKLVILIALVSALVLQSSSGFLAEEGESISLEKCSDYLLQVMEFSEEDDLIPVLINFTDTDLTPATNSALEQLDRFDTIEEFEKCEDLTAEETQTFIEAKRSAATELYNTHNTLMLEELGIRDEEVAYQSHYSPFAELKLTKS